MESGNQSAGRRRGDVIRAIRIVLAALVTVVALYAAGIMWTSESATSGGRGWWGFPLIYYSWSETYVPGGAVRTDQVHYLNLALMFAATVLVGLTVLAAWRKALRRAPTEARGFPVETAPRNL